MSASGRGNRQSVDRGSARPDPWPRLPWRLSPGLPKAEQVATILEALVTELEPGDPLPAERVLSERFRVARMTVRQAFDDLVTRGLVYRVHGAGTFVAAAGMTQTQALTSFTEDMVARGMRPGSFVRFQQVVPARRLVATRLRLVVGAPVVCVERVRTADGAPMALETAQLPAARFPGLEAERLVDRSLYELLERRWGARPVAADQRVRVTHLDDDEAGLLDVAPGSCGMLIQRVTEDERGALVEYVRSLYRADRYGLRMRLQREASDVE